MPHFRTLAGSSADIDALLALVRCSGTDQTSVARIGTRSGSPKDPVTTVLQLPFAWRNVRFCAMVWSTFRSADQ